VAQSQASGWTGAMIKSSTQIVAPCARTRRLCEINEYFYRSNQKIRLKTIKKTVKSKNNIKINKFNNTDFIGFLVRKFVALWNLKANKRHSADNHLIGNHA
jgi:hypothetical protein